MNKKAKKNIAQIIPAVKLPRDLTPFWSYRIPEELTKKVQVGSIARISFRRKEILGIVAETVQEIDAGFKLKELDDIVPGTHITTAQMEIAHFISRYYVAPLGLVCKLMLPDMPKKSARHSIRLNPSPEIGLPEKRILASFDKEYGAHDRILLVHSFGSERHRLFAHLASQEKTGTQTLILLPEFFDVFDNAGFYINLFGAEKTAVLASDLTKNQYFAEWQKVQSGQARVIIGTRQAIFAPFRQLGIVIVDEEHNSSYKQWDQNPRYHAVDTAVKLSGIHKARIILSSPTPSLESYHRASSDFHLIDLSQPLERLPVMIDMAVERKKGNETFISERLQHELLENIYAKRQAVIFIPRLGEKTAFQCKDCGYIAECETCQNALISHKGKLYCPRCKDERELLRSCPKCLGQNIGSFGGGSERVFEETKALFENKNIRIARLDSGGSEDGQESRKLFEDFRAGKIDILVGTQMVWKNWQMKNLGIVAAVFPEIVFSTPGFRSREKSYQFLSRLYRLAQDTTVIIETHKPEHKYFAKIREETAVRLLQDELSGRSDSISAIPYPPLGKLIKLIYKNPDRRICEQEARWQYQQLKTAIFGQTAAGDFEIMPPFPAQNYREFGKYRWHIILRHRAGLSLEQRDAVLSCIKKDWIIDIDPDEIL